MFIYILGKAHKSIFSHITVFGHDRTFFMNDLSKYFHHVSLSGHFCVAYEQNYLFIMLSVITHTTQHSTLLTCQVILRQPRYDFDEGKMG